MTLAEVLVKLDRDGRNCVLEHIEAAREHGRRAGIEEAAKACGDGEMAEFILALLNPKESR